MRATSFKQSPVKLSKNILNLPIIPTVSFESIFYAQWSTIPKLLCVEGNWDLYWFFFFISSVRKWETSPDVTFVTKTGTIAIAAPDDLRWNILFSATVGFVSMQRGVNYIGFTWSVISRFFFFFKECNIGQCCKLKLDLKCTSWKFFHAIFLGVPYCPPNSDNIR